MSLTIREQIFQYIKTNLPLRINGTGDYVNTLASGAINIIHGQNESILPATHIWVYPGTERIDRSKGEKGKFYKILPILLEGWIKVSAQADMNTKINEWLADQERAMMTETTFGGIIIDLFPTEMEAVVLSDLSTMECGSLCTWEIHYQQNIKDPTSN